MDSYLASIHIYLIEETIDKIVIMFWKLKTKDSRKTKKKKWIQNKKPQNEAKISRCVVRDQHCRLFRTNQKKKKTYENNNWWTK